jgi:hypothetical protein
LKDHSKNVTPDDKYILILAQQSGFPTASWTISTFDMSTGKLLAQEKTGTSMTPGMAKEALNYFLIKHPTLGE